MNPEPPPPDPLDGITFDEVGWGDPDHPILTVLKILGLLLLLAGFCVVCTGLLLLALGGLSGC